MDLLTVFIAGSVASAVFHDFRQAWVSEAFSWYWFVILTWGLSGWSYLFSTLWNRSLAVIGTILTNTVLHILVSGTLPFLRPETIYTDLPFLGFLSSGFMACDSYIVSFTNQFPVQYGRSGVWCVRGGERGVEGCEGC